MAKKSKGFGKLLKQQRGRQPTKAGQKALDKFEQQVRQGPLAKTVDGFVSQPKGVAKMSDVLEAFVEPYEYDEMTLAERRNILGVAVIAWNLAIAPQQKRQKMLATFMAEGLRSNDPIAQQEVLSLIDAMIERKRQIFDDNKRYILNYQLEDLGSGFHLSVASTLIVESP